MKLTLSLSQPFWSNNGLSGKRRYHHVASGRKEACGKALDWECGGLYLVGGEFIFGMKNSSLPHKDVVQKHLLKISEVVIQLLKLLLMELFNYD